MNSNSKTQDEFNEEARREVVAEAFGPILDEILANNTNSEAKLQDTDDDTDGWPKIWSSISPTKLKFTRLKYPKDYKTDCDERRCGIPADSRYQEPVDLKASLHNFRVYVNETEYFMSGLPHVYARWSSNKVFNENGLKDIRKTNFNYKTEPYYAMICGAYIASHLSGISLLNIFDKSAGNLISSFVRYHFYYQIRKFMQHTQNL